MLCLSALRCGRINFKCGFAGGPNRLAQFLANIDVLAEDALGVPQVSPGHLVIDDDESFSFMLEPFEWRGMNEKITTIEPCGGVDGVILVAEEGCSPGIGGELSCSRLPGNNVNRIARIEGDEGESAFAWASGSK
jgi:hypothetical protein